MEVPHLLGMAAVLHQYRMIGLQPFGVALPYVEYDPHHKSQLYHNDPSGNYSVGRRRVLVLTTGQQSSLERDYEGEISMEDAIALVSRMGCGFT
jgi:20S proteasome alpha/beta subunit